MKMEQVMPKKVKEKQQVEVIRGDQDYMTKYFQKSRQPDTLQKKEAKDKPLMTNLVSKKIA